MKPYDHRRLYDVRDQRDVVIGRVKKDLGIHLSAKTQPSAMYTVSVVKNGDNFRSLKAIGQENGAVVEFADTPSATGRTYYLVQVEGSPTPYPEVPGAAARSGNMVGLSNPIYFNFDPNF